MDKLKEQISLSQNRLKEMLGDAETGRVGSYKVTWKATNGRETCLLSKLKKADPANVQALEEYRKAKEEAQGKEDKT